MTSTIESLVLPLDMVENPATAQLKSSFDSNLQYKHIHSMGIAIKLLTGRNLSQRTAVVELIRAGLKWKIDN